MVMHGSAHAYHFELQLMTEHKQDFSTEMFSLDRSKMQKVVVVKIPQMTNTSTSVVLMVGI